MSRLSSIAHLSRRRALVLTVALAGCATQPAAPPRVLFVCRAGTVKSPIAREELRRMAAARGMRIEVRSRGIAPEDHVSPTLGAALARDGLDTRREPAMPLAPDDLAWADIVVVFDALPPALSGRQVRDWSDTPSFNERYADAQATLHARLEALLGELK